MKKQIFAAAITLTWIAVQSLGNIALADNQTSAANVDWSNGVVQGLVANQGAAQEMWIQNPAVIQMTSLAHSPDTNQLALQGQVPNYSGDIIIEVVSHDASMDKSLPTNWAYSVPVVGGQFAVSVVLPYRGTDDVIVGLPSISSSLGVQSGYAQTRAQNNQPTLSAQQMALLQSWAVNYNESTAVQHLAQSVTAGSTSPYQTMQRVSDWVSAHVAYNWNVLRNGQVVWQQASQVYERRTGVCQDESFLAAAMLRSLGIPTQVVAGEGVSNGSAESHEWVQSWDGQRWVTFDPTWDQVYATQTKVGLPAKVNHVFFDAKPTVFATTHKHQTVDTW